MENLKLISSLLFCLSLAACSSNETENKPVVASQFDLSGFYRSEAVGGQVQSVTSIEVFNKDEKASVLRSGLSHLEYAYFNELNEVHWADSQLGRELILNKLKAGEKLKSTLSGNEATLKICGDKKTLADRSMDFIYCLNLRRKTNELTAKGDLELHVFEFGKKVNEIKSPFSVFLNDRWGVDYFGNWSGLLTNRNGNLSMATGQNLFLTFQPVSETDFILRPHDITQRIYLGGESFALWPEDKKISDLETSANPYVNFVYVSERDGNRKIYFNSYVRATDRIEGNVTFNDGQGFVETLATYVLSKD